MARFTEITIHGWRRLAAVRLELRSINVLIGANGLGKSSFLDTLHLLAESAQGRLNDALGEQGGLTSVLTIDHAQRLELALKNDIATDYLLSLQPRGNGYIIDREILARQEPSPFRHIESKPGDIRYFGPSSRLGQPFTEELIRPTWEHDEMESSLAQLPRMLQEPESFRQRLASSSYYHSLDVGPDAPVRRPQGLRPASLPGNNGEDLVSCLYSLRETNRDRFDAIHDTLVAAFSGFERLDFPPVAAGTLAMTWRDRRFSRPLYMHQLSEGALRFLWLATLLASPDIPAVTMLDEPEVSLHPELLSLLVDLMREAAERTQLIVATHSDRLVRFLEPNEVLVMDSDEQGLATFRWADSMDLNDWLEDYSLDELWQNGRLGARA